MDKKRWRSLGKTPLFFLKKKLNKLNENKNQSKQMLFFSFNKLEEEKVK